MTAPKRKPARRRASKTAGTQAKDEKQVLGANTPQEDSKKPEATEASNQTDEHPKQRETGAENTRVDKGTGGVGEGDVCITEEESTTKLSLHAHVRPGETRGECWERLRKEARAAGMPKGQGPGTAYQWATEQADKLFPSGSEPVVSPSADAQSSEGDVNQSVLGLGSIPADWPTLPANATLQAEISWVSANRLRVRDGTGVDLSRAISPAPSYSALSWLETSILFPSKFADISVKATASQADETEHIRREKMAIEEIRGLLAEMLEAREG